MCIRDRPIPMAFGQIKERLERERTKLELLQIRHQ
jgi:hypothetical protein